MRTVPSPRRLFVAGQQVEYWEHPDVPFGWSPEEIQAYAEQGDWLLVFNAIVLAAPRPETDLAS